MGFSLKERAGVVGLFTLAGAALTLFACSSDSITKTDSDATEAPDSATSAADASMQSTHDDAGANARDSGADAEVSCQIDAGPLDDAAVHAGIALVKQYKCQQCHGQVLSGSFSGVPNGAGGLAYPPNLTPDPGTGLGCWTDDLITRAMLVGVDDQGRSLCPPMPKFADAGLDEAGAQSIATFLRSLTPIVSQVPDTDCPAPTDATDAGGD